MKTVWNVKERTKGRTLPIFRAARHTTEFIWDKNKYAALIHSEANREKQQAQQPFNNNAMMTSEASAVERKLHLLKIVLSEVHLHLIFLHLI